ncbi:MAG: Ig-like domain-containing protein [Cytophagaceae bacterium]
MKKLTVWIPQPTLWDLIFSRIGRKFNVYRIGLLTAFFMLTMMSNKVYSQASNFGVNLAGLEFGDGPGGSYTAPTAAELDYYKARGIKLIRLPFMWERAQPSLNGALASAYMGQIDGVIAAAKTRSMSIILDVHNYCRYNNQVIGQPGSGVTNAHFADLWTKLATRYANEPTVYAFDLMNEPSELGGASWFNSAQAAINGIRTVDNSHIIMVEGDFWSHADVWVQYNDNLKNLVDPANKIIYHAHQYFDSDGSGTYSNNTMAGNGKNVNSGVNAVSPFVNWLNTNNKKGFIGEYGVPNNADVANWNQLMDNMLAYLSANCVGGTYWAGGPWWGNYILSCEPDPITNPDRPVMATLKKYVNFTGSCGTTPPANTPPTVSLTSPANGTTYTAPASVVISANASDANGTVSKVDFYNGSTLLNSDLTAPYSFTWSNVAAGNYTITAKATDNANAVTTSTVVNIVVNTAPVGNQAPTVSITSPANGTSFTAPASITINASASDADGTVSKVDFYNGTTLLNSDVSAPYSFVWSNVAAGNYTITAKATDNAGAVTSTSVNVTVTTSGGTNQIPVISITSPANGDRSFTAPASITINVNASDPDGSIAKVDFYNGNTLLGTVTSAPYTYVWNNVPAAYYQIVAKATDNSGATAIASSNIAVNPGTGNQAPSVSITSPAGGAGFTAPASITINANASDADGTISKVDFYNGSTLLGTDLTAPYSFTWTNVGAGSYTLTAQATDNANAVSTSAGVSIVVSNTPPANQAPSVSISAPANGASFTAPASVTITANASDADGTVSKVDFYNGATLLGTDLTAPYSFVWTNVAAGSYTLTAKATDNANAVTTSAAVSIIVSNTPPPANQAPAASITSPANGANFTAPASIVINASASDADGTVSKVDFYNGATLLGTDVSAPYSFTISGAAAGSYSLKAVATDNAGATGSSAVVTVTVSNGSTTVGINGPSCVNQNVATSFTLTPEAGFASSSWWTTGEATVVASADGKSATITYSSNASGAVTISCGVNYNNAPWYKEYTKTIQIGGCAAPRFALADMQEDVTAAPNPFMDQTTVSVKTGDKILSIRLFDMNGREQMNSGNIDLEQITLGAELKTGIYILHVVTESGTLNKRIIKTE